MTKAAVIAKPSFRFIDDSFDELKSILNSFDELYVFEEMGGRKFADGFSNVKLFGKLETKSYVKRFKEIVKVISDNKISILITVGGDGIASYAASEIIAQGADISILGFPAGTANIGPIVQSEISSDFMRTSKRLDAIKVSSGDVVLGYAFNDVILGSTILGTIGGKMANICALKLAADGVVEECVPSECAVTDAFELRLNGKVVDLGVMKGRTAQICVSTLHQDKLNGRAVMGGLGESQGFEHPAAIALLDKIAVDARPETWNCQGLRVTGHISFCEKDIISLKGFEKDTCVILDGNPFEITQDEITLQCIPDAVNVLGYRR